MAFSSVDAIVLREVRYKEADRILTLYTRQAGKITAKARGALRKSSRTGAATQQLTFSEMTLFGNMGKYTVNEATVIEPFSGLRDNFENFALGCYFSECVETLTEENVPEEEILQLLLNSLYALSNSMYAPKLIKAVFEIRLMSLLGYMPDIEACCVCGREVPLYPCLGLKNGRICCRECRSADIGPTDYLCTSSLNAIKYAISSPPKRIFSFDINGEELERMSQACEDYIIFQSDMRFQTLDYWKKIKI